MKVAGAIGPEGLVPTTSRFGTALADISRCRACGHMQLEPMPTADTLAVAYAEAESDAYAREEAGQRATARLALERLTAHLAPGIGPPRLLDVGCWLGFLLDEARRRGWEVTGLEPSRYASAYAREVLGLDVRTAGLEDEGPGGPPRDAIVMGDVIEHLVDPGAVLERLRSWTAPGALLYLALPDAGSVLARALGGRWWSVLPTHVQYFTRASIVRLLIRHGWRVLDLRTAPKAFSLAYYLSRISGYSGPLGAGLVRVAEAGGISRRLVAPDFRDRMALVARRVPDPLPSS